jgi:ParB family chromosome partitioning protein
VSDGSKRPIVDVPLSLIDEPEIPSRSAMDDELLADLEDSIRRSGFFGAIQTVRAGDRFRVVAGSRRRIAAGRAGLVTMPCNVYEADDPQLEAIQDDENLSREELNVVDQAVYYSQLLEKRPEEGVDGLARRVRKSLNYVDGRLQLLGGDDEILEALRASKIRIGVAQLLNKVGHDQYRRMYLRMAVENGASIGTVTQWVSEYKRIHAGAVAGEQPAPAVEASGPVAQHSYFACVICQRDDDMGHMRQINVHDYCEKSRLVPAIAAARDGAEYFRFPRTRDEAIALHTRVRDRFPELFEEPAAQ